jgi:4-hydroxy-2-oxoheptanedioate aldolase
MVPEEQAQAAGLKNRLARGESSFGIWNLFSSAACIEILAQSGLDFLILDNEHGAFSFSELENGVRACQGAGTDALVRVSRPDQVEIQKTLDIGVQGILVPQVRTAAEVSDVVAACRLAPEGRRGFNPFTRAGQYRGNARSIHFRPELFTVGVLVENLDAVRNLPAILKVPGLDLIYVGVYDLSCAMGVPGMVDHPEVLKQVEAIAAQAVAAGIAVGLMVASKSAAGPWEAKGFRFFVFKPDTAVFADSIQSLLR